MKRFEEWKPPKFNHKIGDLYETEYGWKVTCPNNLSLGKNTDIGTNTYINARYGVIIEEDVQIGSGCRIYSHDSQRDIIGQIIICKGVNIGANSVILPKKEMVHYIRKHVKAGSVVS